MRAGLVDGGARDAVECDADLVPNPVHYASATDIHRKRGGTGQGLLDRVFPTAARADVGLVYPDLQPARLTFFGVLSTLREAECRFGIDPAVGKKEEVSRHCE
jgi:hypothetical protein